MRPFVLGGQRVAGVVGGGGVGDTAPRVAGQDGRPLGMLHRLHRPDLNIPSNRATPGRLIEHNTAQISGNTGASTVS